MYQKKAVVTIGLMAANVVIFFFLVFQGRTEDPVFMIEHGAMLTPLVGQGEYYRIITSIFLHFDFSHLMNNMLSLGLLGWQLELTVGKICYYIYGFRNCWKSALHGYRCQNRRVCSQCGCIRSYFWNNRSTSLYCYQKSRKNWQNIWQRADMDGGIYIVLWIYQHRGR